MAKRSVHLTDWKMWVMARYADVVVDIPDGTDERDAQNAIIEYISLDLEEGGKTHELFSRERKCGDPEAGNTEIYNVTDAPPDAPLDLRLRLVEDDDGGHVEVEFVDKVGADELKEDKK